MPCAGALVPLPELMKEVQMSLKEIEILKKGFRELCGALSIDELMSNTELIKVIEKLERLFLLEQSV